MGAVPNLDEGHAQLNERFPKRDKASDGLWGNKAHQESVSSHNGDKSGNAEWKDGDKKDEVRARDWDKDLKDPDATMEQVVQEWVRLARAGKLWWVRYIIFNKRIWHKRDGYKTRVYTGANKHDHHAHVNSDFTEKADEVTGTDWGLKNFRKPKPPAPKPPVTTPKPPVKPAPPKPAPRDVKVDGVLGPKTVTLWQYVTHQKQTGKLDEAFVKWLQTHLLRVDHRLKVDGDLGPKTIAALQRYLKSPVDGIIDKDKSNMVIALQRRLNENPPRF